MSKRQREENEVSMRIYMSGDYLETGESIHTGLCNADRCTTRLVWEAIEGGTIHDGAEFWLEDCKCHEEEKKHYCSKCRDKVVCEECYISSEE